MLDREILRVHSEAAIPRGDRLTQLAPALRFGTGVHTFKLRDAVNIHGVVRLVEPIFLLRGSLLSPFTRAMQGVVARTIRPRYENTAYLSNVATCCVAHHAY